jgi:hypothetical protein
MGPEGPLSRFKYPPTVPILSQINPVRTPQPTSWRSILILTSHLRPSLQRGLFPSGFPTKTIYEPLISAIRVQSPAHLTFLDLITWIIFGEEYRLWSSFLCSFPRYLVPLRSKYYRQHSILKHIQLTSRPLCERACIKPYTTQQEKL